LKIRGYRYEGEFKDGQFNGKGRKEDNQKRARNKILLITILNLGRYCNLQ